MLQEENDRLSSERDAALANLRESEENVFDMQQAIEVHTCIMITCHAYMIYAGLFYCVILRILTDCHYSSLLNFIMHILLLRSSCTVVRGLLV